MNKTLNYYMSQSSQSEKINIEAIKNNFYLLQESEIELLKNDKKLFKHFYGEDNYQLLYDFFLNENTDTRSYRFRYGKTKCLINILEEKIKKEKNKSKIFYLENELSKIRTKERKLKIKNENFLILEEKNKKLNINSLINGWEKGLSKGLSFVFSSDKPEDGKVKKYIKLLLKVISIGLGIVMYVKAAIAMPILLLPIVIMAGYFLYKILALGTKAAIKVYSKVISQSWVSKIFGIREEKLKEMSNSAEEFKTKFETFIDEKEKAAKKIMTNFIQNKVMKFGENNPKLTLTLKIALLLYKSWRIFLSPVTFIIQFFSGMLLKTCGSVADSLLKIIKKESTVEAVIGGIGLDAEALGLKKETTEITKESLLNSLENDYYEHIKNQTVKKSLFAKHYDLYNERVIDQTKDNFFSSFYKKNKVEVVSASFNKNNFKFDISPISGAIKIKKDKNQIKDAEEIKNILKSNGLKDENKIQINNDGTIVTDDENYKIIKSEVFNSKTPEQKPEEEQKENEEEQKNNEEKTEDNLLENNEKLFISIDNDSVPENLKIVKDKPTDSDDILGYIELTKKEKKDKNYRFTGRIFIKKIFNYKNNKMISAIFEEENSSFQDVTEKEAVISLRIENDKYVINSGKFLGMFGEKSEKGKLFATFKDYINFSLNEIKKPFLDKYQLEIKKLNSGEKTKLESSIDDELAKITNISFKDNDGETIKARKIASLEKAIDFTNIKSEETKNDEGLLKNKTLYINIKEDEKIDISDLKIQNTKPTDGVGYIELTKKENSNVFTADIYLKKIIDYKKNDLLKTIFEVEEKQNDFVKLTEEPAELELKMENNKFILSQKGGFLGFNKKISKVGKINSKYKEYVSKTISEIEKTIIKNNKEIKKDEPILKEKLENISNIDWETNITEIKEKKIEDIENSLKDKLGSEMEKAEKEETGALISQRNAITLGLFSVISGSAIAWHMGGGSAGLGMIVGSMMDIGGKASQSVAKDLFQKVSDSDLTKQVKFDGQGQKTFFQKLYESFGLKFKGNLDSAKVNPKNPEDIKISGSGNELNKGPDIESDTDGFEVDEKLKTIFSSSYTKDELLQKVKETWVNTHQDSGIKIEDITKEKHPDLFKNLEEMTNKIDGSIKNPKDPFFQKSDTLKEALKTGDSSKIQDTIKKMAEKSFDKGWLNKEIGKIPENKIKPPTDKPIPSEDKPIPQDEPMSKDKPGDKTVIDDKTKPTADDAKKTDVADDGKKVNTSTDSEDGISKEATNVNSAIENMGKLSSSQKEELKNIYKDIYKSPTNPSKIFTTDNENKIIKLLNISGDKDLKKAIAQEILSSKAFKATVIEDSYQYVNNDEQFLFNEYFKLEGRLNKWKK